MTDHRKQPDFAAITVSCHHHLVHKWVPKKNHCIVFQGWKSSAWFSVVLNSQQLLQKSTASLPTGVNPIESLISILEEFIPADLIWSLGKNRINHMKWHPAFHLQSLLDSLVEIIWQFFFILKILFFLFSFERKFTFTTLKFFSIFTKYIYAED